MSPIRTASCIFVTIAAAVHAGAAVSLVPNPAGPSYLPAQSVAIDVNSTQTGGSDIYLRGLRFDFNASDPAIVKNSFDFDFSAQQICLASTTPA